MYVYVSVRYALLDDTECRDPVYCIAHAEYSQYFTCWYTVCRYHCFFPWYSKPVYTSSATRSVYYIALFQDFTLRSISGLPTVRGTAGIQCITRRVFHSSMLQYVQVRYSGYTLSPRRNWTSVVLLTYS